MKLGAHQSIAGGYTQALERIKNIGGNCLQIFSSSPRGWSFTKLDEVQRSLFLERNAELKIKGSIIHLGSFKDMPDMPTLVNNIIEVLKKTTEESLFIIENAGNNKIGKDLKEIAEIINQVNNPRVRVCLDTCHLHAAGYDFTTSEKLDKFIIEFDKLIGLKKLELFHINDSKDPFNSGRDRHENIGRGSIGLKTFKLLLNHPITKHLPFIIETPGFDENGPDKQNLDILKSLV